MNFKKFIETIAKTFFLISCCLCFQFGLSQSQISFRQLSVKDGLSQNSTVSIAQDSIGYLWIATQNGLNRYDGKSFMNYPFDFVDITRPTFSHLGKIYVDRKGDVFIIPLDKKLYKYDQVKDSFGLISEAEGISTIYQDMNKNYWIGTYTKGLYISDSTMNNMKVVIPSDQLSKTIYDIAEQGAYELLITSDEKIIEVDINTFETFHVIPETILGERVVKNFSTSLIDSSEKQWIGTFGDGLYYRTPKNKTLHRISQIEFTDPLPNNLNILNLHSDHRNRLWIATYDRGLYMINFEAKTIAHFSAEKYNPGALHYNDVLCIYEDYTGTIWFGTDGAGLSYYDEYLEKFNSFTNLQTPENINIDVVRAITTDNNQNIWLGTSGKGLTEYQHSSNSWRTFTLLNSELPSNRIMSLYLDEDKDLWIGTQGKGLVIYNEKSGFNNNLKIDAKTIWNIFKDSKNRIWLATQNKGLIQFDKSKGIINSYEKIKNGLTSNNIKVVTEGNIGNLWIGTNDNGIVEFNVNTEVFTAYKHKEETNSLSGDGIKSLYFDNDILWVGTSGNGLDAFDTKIQKFYHFTDKDGLANNVVYAILPDKKDNLWLSSNKGITKFSIDKSSFKNPSIKNYNNYAGLATEFNTGAYFKDKKGQLYFGGLDGFYWFDPNVIKENSILPNTTITGFEVLNERYLLKPHTKLRYNQNTLTFTFSSMQYALPEKNLYQYKLLNYDEGWINSENINSVRYTRLPPGDYTFQVKSSNYDGVWNETPATFGFTIKAPWFFNIYSKLAYALLILSVLYGIYWYLKWRLKMKMKLELEHAETERFKKLNDYKSKLYTDIAHEFRTPLTLISGPIDSKLTQGKLSDYDYANFSTIKRNTKRLTALVDQLLQLAKLEKGKLKLTIAKGNLGLFLHTIAESFSYNASAKEIDYTYSIDKIEDVWYDEDTIEKIISNLVSNAIKYTPEKGFCSFKAFEKEKRIHIEITNSVEDISTIQLDKLFDRFYQKDEYSEGAGVGLSLVKELVKLYKGAINVTAKDNSILFNLELPLDKNEFNQKEIVVKTEENVVVNELNKNIDLSDENLEDKNEEPPILLIVEDNNEVRAFIKMSLQHTYKIIEAVNGKEGIDKAIEFVPDIILSDIRMPVADGITLCNTLKNDERTSHIPIILLTADTAEENELKGLESGADDFITKPFKLRILENRLKNLILLRKALRDRYSQEFILKPTDISITSTDEAFLNKLQEIIDADFANPEFNAVAFSRKMNMSRMQLHRKLLAYTGLSTSTFIRSQRLKQAIEILKTSDVTINEVAYAVGFNTSSYFIKSFKEIYKKTPSEYSQSIDK